MQNNRFYNTLMIKQLHNNYVYEKYLQAYSIFSVYKTMQKEEDNG